MKRILWILAVAGAVLSSCTSKSSEPANKAEQVIAALNDPASRYVVVACHRGDWRNYPENSLGAIESVIRMGADIVEIDLKLTKDSVLVLSHDRTCNRMTTGKGDISTMTYDSLATFNLKTAHNVAIPGTRITTFQAALEACKDRIVINVDQGYQYYDLVVKLTDAMDMTDQILIKGKKAREVVAREMEGSRMMYMPIIDIQKPKGKDLFAQYEDWYAQTGEKPLAYEVCFSELNEEVEACCQKVIAQGSKLWINTLWASLCGGYEDDAAFEGDPDKVYGKILDLGTSIIQTDRPELLIGWLKKQGRR